MANDTGSIASPNQPIIDFLSIESSSLTNHIVPSISVGLTRARPDLARFREGENVFYTCLYTHGEMQVAGAAIDTDEYRSRNLVLY